MTAAETILSERMPHTNEIHKGFGSALGSQTTPLVHYTGIKPVVDMLKQSAGGDGNDAATFRMYHVEGFHDPSEGAVVEILKAKYPWLQMPRDSDAYVCSFAAPEGAPNAPYQKRMEDNLMFWLLYGDHGKGCSIQFQNTPKDLFRVEYWGEEHQDGESWLTPILEEINAPAYKSIANICGDVLAAVPVINQYRYCVKSDDYKHEKEHRLVCLRSGNDGIEFDEQKFPRIRRYINSGPVLNGGIFTSGTVITVGPQVRDPQAVKAYIESLIKKAGISGTSVRISGVKYQSP